MNDKILVPPPVSKENPNSALLPIILQEITAISVTRHCVKIKLSNKRTLRIKLALAPVKESEDRPGPDRLEAWLDGLNLSQVVYDEALNIPSIGLHATRHKELIDKLNL